MSTKRILSLVLALVMVLGTFGTVFADVAETSNEKIDWLVQEGMVKGNEAGDLMLDKEIDRASTAKMIAVALDAEAEAQGLKGVNSGFKDMTTAHWANGFVNYAAGKSLVKGDQDKNFMPSKDITYGEVTTILVRLILNRDLTAEEKGSAGSWMAPYIAKATELNLFEGVSIPNFEASAIREDVLVMFYNAMMNKEIGNYSIIKAIVLENNRVERVGENEVVVEVIKEVQRANFADASRKTVEKGDQERYVIDANKAGTKEADVENLLGKVADFTINKAGEVVGVKLDETHKYLEGPITATRNKLNVGGTSYTVELDERYRGNDERIFRTYLNDDAFTYERFYQDVAKADYARVTVKNGKVLFIDAYQFDDIAPVQEVKRDAKDIYVYNDERDARVEKFEPRSLVIGYNDAKFSRIDREDIKENDVVHVYKKNRVIVRQDAMVTGEYEKVERDRDNRFYAHVDGKGYLINDVNYRRPVFAHDSKAYTTLFAKGASEDLRHFYKENVTILKDINGDLQLFGAEVDFNEGMALVQQILARGQGRFVKSDDARIELDEDYKSIISTHNLKNGVTTTNQRLNAFDTRDLVFVQSEGDNIGRLVRIETEKEMKRLAVELKSTNKDDMNNSYIRLKDNNNFRYQVLDRTNVFAIDKDGRIAGTTVAKLQASLKSKEVEAYVLSDAAVTKLIADKVIVDRNRITKEENVAHTIVFLDVDYTTKTNAETVLVTNVYTARSPHYVVGQGPDNTGKVVIDRIAVGTNLSGMLTDDIVALNLTDNDDKLVDSFDVLIKGSDVKTKSYRVIGGDIGSGYSRYEYRRLVLQDANKNTITKWLVRDVEEFGTITIDSVVTFHEDDNKDIDVIRVYGRTTPVTANFDFDGAITLGTVTYVNRAENIVLVEGREEIVRLAETARLFDAKGNLLEAGKAVVLAKLVKDVTVLDLKAIKDDKGLVTELRLAKVEEGGTTPDPEVPGDEVTATATFVMEFSGIKSYDLTLENAELTDVDKVEVDGVKVDTEIIGNALAFNTINGEPTEILVTVKGVTNPVKAEIK